MNVTRFAPSPNGPLHLGHALSAIVAHDLAAAGDGHALLRIEDIDRTRSRPEHAAAIRTDLAWLGLDVEEVAPQSERLGRYTAAADRLRADGLLYPCSCTRAEIAAAATRIGAEGPVYAGRCRTCGPVPGRPVAWRLDMDRAIAWTGPLLWRDRLAGEQAVDLTDFGDVVLVRKNEPASYHLAVTLDDAADGITLVTRGYDLFNASHVHRLLQALLDLPVPEWHHHGVLVDASGRKLAKSRNSGRGAFGLPGLREAGADGREWADRLRAGEWPAGISLAKP